MIEIRFMKNKYEYFLLLFENLRDSRKKTEMRKHTNTLKEKVKVKCWSNKGNLDLWIVARIALDRISLSIEQKQENFKD